jgi:O-acetylhomoserine (thiol)-lyase
MRPETIAIHSGFDSDPASHAVAVPIYQTAAYAFDSADHATALFNLEEEGYRYSRISNPTVAVLEKRVTELEGGIAALATASGQAALHYAFANVAAPMEGRGGGNIVSTPQLYGTSHTLLAHVMPNSGVTAHFAADDSPEAMAARIDENTRALFCETVGNPAGNICDIEAIAKVAHAHGVPLIVDNTVATPILLRPIAWGADIVVHSLTKFLGGHGSAMGGILVDGGNFDWQAHAARFPQFTQADPSYHGLIYAERFGRAAFTARARSVLQRTTGAILSPMSAFLLLQGIETVALRVQRHVENARAVAGFLKTSADVEWVEYAGFADNRYHALADKYLGGQVPSLLTFGVKGYGVDGGFEAGKRFYDALKLIKRVVNIGDAKSLACHPASTTHRQMPQEEQRKAGVTPETIRLSIGIEHKDDIIADIAQALAAATAGGQVMRAAE